MTGLLFDLSISPYSRDCFIYLPISLRDELTALMLYGVGRNSYNTSKRLTAPLHVLLSSG